MSNYINKLEELVKNEEKVSEIFTGSLEEIRDKLATNGVILTDEEFYQLQVGMNTSDDSDELSADDLDNVAGGCIICYIVREIIKIINKVKKHYASR